MIDGGLAPIICKTAYISHCYQPVSSLWLPSPLRYLDPGARVQSDQRLLECWRVSRKVIFEGRKDTGHRDTLPTTKASNLLLRLD